MTARLELHRVTEECRIQTRTVTATGSYNLKVTVAPYQAGTDQLFLVTLEDVFSQHRQKMLERMFLHDVLNAAGGLQGLLTNWTDLSPEETAEYCTIAAEAATALVEEIEAYRDMAAAERGELVVHSRAVRGRDVVLLVQGLYQKHIVATGKHIEIRTPDQDPGFSSDPVILKRVVGNLLKNALEASRPGQTVVVSYTYDAGPHFSVHNEAVMPISVQQQVFQRSFSTKATHGRGLGTYGARLLTELYLKGTIHFESRDGVGTIFSVDLPASLGH
jgi:signal transduction histidine kinase